MNKTWEMPKLEVLDSKYFENKDFKVFGVDLGWSWAPWDFGVSISVR